MSDFLPIKECSGYAAHSSGHIFSLKTKRTLKPFVGSSGYKIISLSENGIAKKYSVHRLIASAFLPNPIGLPWVNHKNGIKTDNEVSNLEWTTPSQNNLHSYALGLNVPVKGEKHFAAKLTDRQVLEIKEALTNGSFYTPLAKKYGVSTTTIGQIKRGLR